MANVIIVKKNYPDPASKFDVTPDTDSTNVSIDGDVIETGLASGVPGKGIPLGGVKGQMLIKKSGTDYDTEWGFIITVSPTEPPSPVIGQVWLKF